MATTQSGITVLELINKLNEISTVSNTDLLLIQNNVQTFKITFQNFLSELVDGDSVFLNNDGKIESSNSLALEQVYPVGSVYINESVATSPSTLLGFGTWQRISQGRVLVGEGVGTDQNNTSRTFPIGEAGGEYTHQLTVSELASHTHTVGDLNITGNIVAAGATSLYDGGQLTSSSTGGNQSHNNIQPYLVVYIWERTA